MSASEFWDAVRAAIPLLLLVAVALHDRRIRTLERRVKELEDKLK